MVSPIFVTLSDITNDLDLITARLESSPLKDQLDRVRLRLDAVTDQTVGLEPPPPPMPEITVHEMEQDIAAWVAQCGYDEVLSALITTCHYWATVALTPPIAGRAALWTAREQALRQAERDGRLL